MGHGIAQVFATAGYRVRGFDEVAAARDTLPARVRRDGATPATLKRIKVFDTVAAAVTGADFVLEAVREDLPTKQKLFAQLEPLVSRRTILASNTSTFPITKIAARLKHPGRCIDMHWFNPPHIVPVVEVVPGKKTTPATVAATMSLAKNSGKIPVHVRRELPGFIVNRVQAALNREVWDLWQRGIASAEDIDRAVSGTLGFRLAAIGPLQVADFAGLDVWRSIMAVLGPDISAAPRMPARIQRMVKQGHFGAKTGQGFYRYTSKQVAKKIAERDRKFATLAKLLYP